MKISVIIPAYNAQQWVAQCIENVLCQTYKNLEIIVIDDGSTDSTAAIVEKYSVTLLRQENAGPSAARNRGLEAATGEYIHFMDVDDWVNLDFYARMSAAVRLADADIAVCGMINEARPFWSSHYEQHNILVAPEDKFATLDVYEKGYAVRYLFRTTFLQRHGLRFERGMLVEDMPVSMEAVLLANRIVTVPGAAYYYRKRPLSLMNNPTPEARAKMDEGWAKASAAREEFMDKHGLRGAVSGNDRWQYKILGLPMLIRSFRPWDGKTKWRFCGVIVAEMKKIEK